VLADDMLEAAADDWYDALSEMGEENHWLGLDDKDDSHAESSGGSQSTSSATL
jgi:hypothetical protein